MRLAVALTTTLGVLAGASAASAATVSVTGGVLTYQADAAKTNQVFFDQGDDGGGPFTPNADVNVLRGGGGGSNPDDDALVAGAGCDTPSGSADPGAFQGLVCHGVTSVVANLGDRHDSGSGSFNDPAPGVFPPFGLQTIPITVNAGDGNDSFSGGNVGDTLNGENGDDNGSGGNGADTISGGSGDDSTLDGENANDTVDGGPGNDGIDDSGIVDLTPTTPTPLPDETSNDTITGGEGGDNLSGGDGNDNVDGGDGSDTVTPGQGVDTGSGGNGNDAVFASEDHAADTYNGGAGNDSISYSGYGASITLTLAGGTTGGGGEADVLAADFENAGTGSGDDSLTGTDANNSLNSGSGNDTVSGAGGNDSLGGDSGNDTLSGGDGADNISGGDGNDTLNGDNGGDKLSGDSGDDVYNGGDGNDTAEFFQGNVNVSLDGVANDGPSGETDNADADKLVENIVAGGGDDTLTGNAALNFIDAGSGDDTVNVVDSTFLRDIVDCGSGADNAAADATDFVEVHGFERCESLLRAPVTRAASTTGLRVTPSRDRTAPFRFTASGTVGIGTVVPPAFGCKGTVTVTFRAGATIVATKRAKLSSACKYRTTASFRIPARFNGKKRLVAGARFGGNRFVAGSSSPIRRPRAG